MSQFIEMFGCKELITLNSVTKVLTGSTPARNNSDYWGGTHLWVSAQDMKSKYIDDTEEKITDLGLSKCKIIPKGSVLFVCRGSIGVIGIANKVCTCNQSICVSICNNSYLSDYVYYALKYNVEVIKNKYGEGTSFKSINQKTFAGLKIPKASNAEQESFVLIAEQADKSKFGGFKSQFIEMFGDPITNDKNWIIRPIKEVAPETTSNHGLTNNVWLLNLDMIESNTGLVIDKVRQEYSVMQSVQAFDRDNVLFSKLRPYLNKVVIPDECGYATTELVPLKPNKDKLNKIYFSFLLKSDKFVKWANDIATGTKMPRMPLGELRNFNCMLPPLELQELFAAIVQQADKSKYVHRRAIYKINRLIYCFINRDVYSNN